MARQMVITPEYKITLRFKQNGAEYASLHYNQDPFKGIRIAFEQAFSLFDMRLVEGFEDLTLTNAVEAIEEIHVTRAQPFKIEG